jgi:hypothetical protein
VPVLQGFGFQFRINVIGEAFVLAASVFIRNR